MGCRCRALAWAIANETTARRLANMSVDESGMGSREPTRRAKVLGILRDALRQKSMGVIEEDTAKGIVKYARPAGVIAALRASTFADPHHHALAKRRPHGEFHALGGDARALSRCRGRGYSTRCGVRAGG